MGWTRNAAVTLLTLAATAGAYAQPAPGDLDPGFGSGGKVVESMSFGGHSAELRAVVLRPGGGLIGVGVTLQRGGAREFAVIGFAADGSLDDAFGANGDLSGDFYPRGGASAAALHDDGRFVLVGSVIGGGTVQPGFALAQYHADTSYDLGFGPARDGLLLLALGWAHLVSDAAVQPDGKILVAGAVTDVDTPVSDFILARLNADGSLDGGFGNGGVIRADYLGFTDAALGVRVLPDGKVLALAWAHPPPGAGTLPRLVLARYDNAGRPDFSFGSGGQVVLEIARGTACSGFALQPDGRIVLVANHSEGDSLFRFEADGAPDSTFGAGGRFDDLAGQTGVEPACGRTVGIDNDGRILVLRSQESAPSTPDLLLTRYEAAGALDTTFGAGGRVVTDWAGGEDMPAALLVPGDGTYVAAGSAFLPDGTTAFALSRYLRVAGAHTPAGSNVSAQPLDARTEALRVSLTFEQVTLAGTTHARSTTTGLAPPAGFGLGDPPTYHEISTTASFAGPVTVCINYSDVSYPDETRLRLLHYQDGAWQDRTTSLDTADDVVCGSVGSFSTFAVFQSHAAALRLAFLRPVRADRVVAFERGSVVPVRFRLVDQAGRPVAGVSARLGVYRLLPDGPVAVPVQGVGSSAGTDVFGESREGRYLYRLDTREYGAGRYLLRVTVEGRVLGEAMIRTTERRLCARRWRRNPGSGGEDRFQPRQSPLRSSEVVRVFPRASWSVGSAVDRSAFGRGARRYCAARFAGR